MSRPFLLAVLAYIAPSFVIAFLWHLVVFHHVYQELAIYREDVIVPLGLLTMFIQGPIFAAAYPGVFSPGGSVLGNGWKYGLLAGLLSWSFTTLAVAAKFPMTSISTFIAIETGFTVAQFAVVGPLIALAYRGVANRAAEA